MNEEGTMQDEDVDGDFSNVDDYASYMSFFDASDLPAGYPVKAEQRFPQGQGQPFFSIATQQNFGAPSTFVSQPAPQQSFFPFSAPAPQPQFFSSGLVATPSTPPPTGFFSSMQPPQSPQQQQQQALQYQQQQLLLRQQELQRQQMQHMQQLPPPPSPISSSPPPPSPSDLSMPQSQLPQITATNLEQCQQLLNEIYQWEQRQKEQLEQVRQFQKQFLMRPQKEGFDMLQTQHQQLKGQILQELRTLTALFQQVILPPADIQKVITLLQDLKVQQVQLELYQHELNRLTLNQQQLQMQQPLCALVIAEQPLPMVITKGKQLEDDPIVVQLLTGASVDVQSFSKVKVAMVCDNQQVKSTSTKVIENDTQTLDSFRRQAKFYLKFSVGTRKNPVRLKFGIQLQIQQGTQSQTVTVESNSSRSFIVITNECQWEEAEGILLKKDAFGEQMDVTWPQFANVLQRHFLRASRQDLVKPARYLTVFDFEYLRDKFFPGETVINQKGYDNFWTWFGKGVQKLRYQRHICPLWQTGLIYGFLTREAVEETLMNEEVGTFLIRFAERHPGLFAVGYKTDDPDVNKSVRHYLIRPEDTGTKKTLPDFLADCSAFLYLLQVTPEIDSNGKPKLRKFSRDVALQPYYSKKQSVTNAQGYDDSLPAHQMARYNF